MSCTAVASECTLHAAIEAANESPVGSDVIKFDPAVFNGEPSDTIAPATIPPEVLTPTTIDGGGCNPGSAVACLNGVNIAGFPLITVKADESTVKDLKLTVPAGGLGIRAMGTGAAKPGVQILGNTIDLPGTTLPSSGITTMGTNGGSGNLIEGNTIRAAFGFNFGIVLRSNGNRVLGNDIEGSGCCYWGVTLDLGASGNQIGGDTPASENVIENFSGGAIRMEASSSHNEVRRNRGAGGLNFINGAGVAAPAVTGGLQSSAAGTAEPGATVRLFRKDTELEGEIKGFLAEAVADGSGEWEATFARIPAETFVAATQTLAGSTSGLGAAIRVAAEPGGEEEGGGEEGGSGGGGDNGGGAGGGGAGGGATGTASSGPAPAPSPSATAAPTAPKVKFTAGPKKASAATTARFRFRAEPAPGARFECKLDRARWARCSSPKTYRGLKPGKHTLRVRAKANGLSGAVAKRRFAVKR